MARIFPCFAQLNFVIKSRRVATNASPLLAFSVQHASGCIGNTGNGLKISETWPCLSVCLAIPVLCPHTLDPISRINTWDYRNALVRREVRRSLVAKMSSGAKRSIGTRLGKVSGPRGKILVVSRALVWSCKSGATTCNVLRYSVLYPDLRFILPDLENHATLRPFSSEVPG